MVQKSVVEYKQVCERFVCWNQDNMLAIFYQLFQVFYASLVDPKTFEGVPQHLFTFIS